MSSTSANKDYYASSLGKSRRNSPGDSQGIPFFQTGQGGRPVLPSFSSAFPNLPFPGPSYPNAYTAPRSSPGRYDLNAQALYPTTQWPTGNTPPLSQGFPNYDMTTTQERYSPQPSYAYSSRNSPPLVSSPTDPRRLPPLATSSSGGDRWQQSAAYGIPAVHGYSNTTNPNNIRSPTASYAPSFNPYAAGSQTGSYTYMTSHDQLSMGPQSSLFDEPLEMRMQPRSTSPYGRGGHAGPMTSSTYPTPPPISPTSEEPTIKKKRKRADAAQLKVLNETYARTAFPSTEERHALAKALDMSARSVQIWFQNKRQSMRQTNRQSNSTSTASHQPYCLPSPQSERMVEESLPHGHGHVHASNFSGGQISIGDTPYMTGGQEIPRSHTSHSSSSHRRYRSPDEAESQHKQWSRGY